MTAHAQPLPARTPPAGPATQSPPTMPADGVTRWCAAGGLRLLTWSALAASGAEAAVAARAGGVSSGPYATLNLSLSVGDDPANVAENRRRLAAAFGAGLGDFVFAHQVHGAGVRVVGGADAGSGAFTLDDAIADADALVTTSPGIVLAILAADCAPVVLHDPVAGVLACVHSGWRGTVARVAAAAIAAMRSLGARPSDVIAGVGPAVAPDRYQVGPDVHGAVTEAFGPAAAALFRPDPVPQRWRFDLWAANRLVLREVGVPDAQIHVTTLPTGPVSPAARTPVNSAARTAAGDLGTSFFSDRAARPCGRLALVARLPSRAATAWV